MHYYKRTSYSTGHAWWFDALDEAYRDGCDTARREKDIAYNPWYPYQRSDDEKLADRWDDGFTETVRALRMKSMTL